MSKLMRAVIFTLAATSIWCLLVQFYGLCSMRLFTLAVFLPALVALVAITIRGSPEVRRNILVGAFAGLLATISYDVFRLPFVFSRQLHLDAVVPALPLFKVFPQFGRLILASAEITPAAHAVGWVYHFSNGITFGVMFAALAGEEFRRRWWWAVVFAVGLELAMLFTPYPSVFGIQIGVTFVIVTLTAHLIFGLTMGGSAVLVARRRQPAGVRA